jgi:hypothetical protein
MQTAMTELQEVFDRVDTMSRHCTDKFIDVNEVSFDTLDSVTIGNETHKLRPIAQRSIAYRLTIPYQYLVRCPAHIQALNMNHWIEKEKNDQLFFRFKGDAVRAIFTPKYKPVDNFEVLERLDSLGYKPDTEVQCHLDDEFMSLNIPDGKRSFSVHGDRMTPGIAIANSEVGLSSLSVSAFVLRLVCTNGLIAKTEIKASYRHVSTRILEEFPRVVSDIAYKLEDQRDKFLISHETPVDNPLSTIDSLSKQFGLKEEEREAVTWAMEYEEGDTMFAIINTYTRAAQFPGLRAESSYNLQKVAGNILSLVT